MIELSLGLNKRDENGNMVELDQQEVKATALVLCAKKCGGCSILEQHGAYIHEDGTVCFEHSLLIRLYDDDVEAAKEVAEILRDRYEQESVALTQVDAVSRFI